MKVWLDWIYDMINLPRIDWIDDGWGGTDKLFHAFFHFGIGWAFALHGAWFGGILFSESFGWLYEMYDSARGVGASGKDLLANNVGLVLGTALGLLIRGN